MATDTTIVGTSGDDVLTGGYGNDALYGGNGNDVLVGNGGNDTLYGGAGNDFLYGDDGNDALYGGDGNDVLYGGNWGNDLLDGGNGDDLFMGEVGNKQMVGGNGIDTVDYFMLSMDGGVTVDLAAGAALHVEGTDTLSSIENVRAGDGNDSLTGDAGNNVFWAGMGNDTLIGGDGNDTLYGENGGDILVGGAGADLLYGGEDGNVTDVFVFENASDSTVSDPDKIYNFISGIDKIDLSGIDANTALEGNQAFVNGFGTVCTENGLWIISDGVNNCVTLYGDTDGNLYNGPEIAIKIMGTPFINTYDIVF